MNSSLKVYFSYFRLTRFKFASALVLSTLSSAMDLLGLSGAIVLLLQDDKPLPFGASYPTAIAVLGSALVLGSLSKAIADSLILSINCDVEYHCRNELVTAISSSSWPLLRSVPQGRWVSLMMSESTMVSNGFAGFVQMCANLASLLPILVFISIFQPITIVPLFFLVVVGFLATRWLKNRAERIEREAQRISVTVGEQASGVMSNIKSVYASREFENWAKQLRKTVVVLFELRIQQLLIAPKNKLTLEMISNLGLVALLYWAALNPTDLEFIALVTVSIYRSMPKVQSLQQSILIARVQSSWVVRWKEAMTSLKPEEPSNERSFGLLKNWSKVSINNLVCSQDSTNPILKGQSLTFNRGEIIKVSGSSGSGKSTLIDSLLGLLTPIHSEVEVDGQQIEGFILGNLGKISYVPQSDVFGVGTFREILTSTKDEYSDQEIWDALDAMKARELVEAKTEGLDTVVESVWSDFSGGEKQRLCLARAILRKPAILILDESTSALDMETEAKVLSNLSRIAGNQRMTVFVISHGKQELIHQCEWEIKDGTIVEKRVTNQ